MPSGSRTQLQNSSGLRASCPKPTRDVFRFRLVILIGVKKIVVSGILFKIQSGGSRDSVGDYIVRRKPAGSRPSKQVLSFCPV